MKSTKKSTSTITPTLKQGTLGFPSTKRAASAANAKGKKPLKAGTPGASTPVLAPPAPVYRKRDSTDSSVSIRSDESATSSSVEVDDRIVERPKKALPPKAAIRRPSGVLQSREGLDNIQGNDETLEHLNKSGRLSSHYAKVRTKTGNATPIHGQGQTKIHEILRIFDLSSEYGPCVGVSRIQRWNRASALGLNPPIEVRDILLTKEALTDTQYSHSVFHDQV